MTSDKIELMAKFHFEAERGSRKGWSGLSKEAQQVRINRMRDVMERLERYSDYMQARLESQKGGL